MDATELEAARAALRERQGAGARYDDPAAPAKALILARRGTAYFARLLSQLPDMEFGTPSAHVGWSRAMVVAHVGYHARGLATYIEARRAGLVPSQPTFVDEAEIIRASTLHPEALRHLFKHAAKHLDVEWRDLNGALWSAPDIAALPQNRAREIWKMSLEIGTTGRTEDLPEGLW